MISVAPPNILQSARKRSTLTEYRMVSGRLDTCYDAGCFPVKMPQKAKSKNRSISWYFLIAYDRSETKLEKSRVVTAIGGVVWSKRTSLY